MEAKCPDCDHAVADVTAFYVTEDQEFMHCECVKCGYEWDELWEDNGDLSQPDAYSKMLYYD